MNFRSEIEEHFKSQANFSFDKTFGMILKDFDSESFELLSKDRVEMTSFREIINHEQVYFCQSDSSFFCITNLSIRKPSVYPVTKLIDFPHPLIFHVVTLTYVVKDEDNLIFFIFPENKIEITYDCHDESIFLKDLMTSN